MARQKLYETQDILNDVYDSSSSSLKTSGSAGSGAATPVSLSTLIAGEDLTNDVLKTEHRYSYATATSDSLIKSGSGFLHTITLMPSDAAAQAATITIYDNTAESGTTIATIAIPAAYFAPVTLTLDVSFIAGLFIGFSGTTDVNVTVSYR